MSKAKPSYFELLKHPKWQEKRLRIMEQAGFECESCGEKDRTLNVHHTYYERGCDPWEYPDASLRCLCDECHERADNFRRMLYREVGLLSEAQLLELIGLARGLTLEEDPSCSCPVEDYHIYRGLVRIFLTLSRHQIEPMTDILMYRDEEQISGQELGDLCRCEEVAKQAKAARHAMLMAANVGGSNP